MNQNHQTYIFNGTLYKIIGDMGLGFRKKAFTALNQTTNKIEIIFFPDVTEKYNDINENKQKFLDDIDELNLLYKAHGDKCIIKPMYTSKKEYVIITNYIQGRILYRYLTTI